jgi:N-[(2S)-2-amino-2-carboxyethyl]-L-glutamate dehydrogenase
MGTVEFGYIGTQDSEGWSVSQRPPFPFFIVKGRTIFRLIHSDIDGCIGVVRDAYIAHANLRTSNPRAVVLRFNDSPTARIIALPTYLASPWNISGIKWIASYPANVYRGFSRASAVVILNHGEHGYPFACLEGSIISAARTAASAVLAAYHLRSASRQTRALGIVGTGLIARYIYRFLLSTGWQIPIVYLYDLDRTRAEQFSSGVCERSRHTEIFVAYEIGELLKACDLTLFATVASRPHVHDATLFEHCPVILNISLRDLDPEILLSAYNIVDDVDHVMQADTSPHLAEKLTGGREFVFGTLADVIAGSCPPDHARPVIFSPFGLGVLDLAVGKWVYDRAVGMGQVVPIPDFFMDPSYPTENDAC